MLGYRRLIRHLGLGRIGLVSPYTSDVQARIVDTWRAAGLHIAAETHLGLSDNFSFATVTEDWIDAALGRMAEAGCDSAVILCTNMRGALPAARREATLGIPILDSVAVTLWSTLDTLGIDKHAFTQWGRWFTA